MKYALTYKMVITYLDFHKVVLNNLKLEEITHYIDIFSFAQTREIKKIEVSKEV